MEQMNKEELIEFFIKQLGNNEILGPYISIEEIRTKLNNIVKNVTYNIEPSNVRGSWHPATGIINIDPSKDYQTNTIVHELLHALSTSDVGIFLKSGLSFLTKCDENNDEFEGTNIAINEGITEFLAQAITGIESSNGYSIEIEIFKIISQIVGQDTIFKKYFDNISNTTNLELDIFREDLIQKYGNNLGNTLNDRMKKVLTLSDDFLSQRKSDPTKLYSQLFSQIMNTLLYMVKPILFTEKDINKSICFFQIIEKYATEFDYEETLTNYINNPFLSYEEKWDIINKIKQQGSVSTGLIETLLFKMPEASTLSVEEKLNRFTQTCKFNSSDYTYKKMLYDLYVESGKINDASFPKMGAFSDIVEFANSIEDLDNKLSSIQYHQIGDYYQIDGQLSKYASSIFTDSNGEIVNPITISHSNISSDTSYTKLVLSKTLSNDAISIFEKELQLWSQFIVNDYYCSLPNQYFIDDDNYENSDIEVELLKDMLIVTFSPDYKTEVKKFLKINPDGRLYAVEER